MTGTSTFFSLIVVRRIYRSGSANLSQWFGNGDGTFTSSFTISVGASPLDPILVDFDNDQDLDILVSNYAGNSVSVLVGSGIGVFSAAATIAGLSGPRSLKVSDFNGDGLKDFAVLSTDTFDISVRLGAGAGTFTAAATIKLDTGIGIQLADLNGDGRDDIVGHQEGIGITTFLNTGSGNFNNSAALSMITTTIAYPFMPAPSIGDLNGDGVLDILAIGHIEDEPTGRMWSFLANTKQVSGIGDLDLSSSESSANSADILDQALRSLTGAQAEVAIAQERLSLISNHLSLNQETLSEVSASISDVDMGAVTSQLVLDQIRQQAQIAAITQANVQQQVVLALLK